MKLRVCGFTKESVVDGPGIRAVVYAQGCPHHCQGCHNPSTWNEAGGYELDVEAIMEMIKGTSLLRGLTFSGGEPFLQARGFAELAQYVKALGLDLLIYTGFTFEELIKKSEADPDIKRLLDCTDILIDGPYREEEKDMSLAFRGSRNQRIIDVKGSLNKGTVVIIPY